MEGEPLSDTFAVKDSGKREQFASGMQRDTTDGKTNWLLVRPGPMLRRWAEHLTRAAAKYDTERQPGEPRNWQLADGMAEYERFQESAARHFEAWLNGERDEDHAAGIIFNINGAEYVREKLEARGEFGPLTLSKMEAAPGAVFEYTGALPPSGEVVTVMHNGQPLQVWLS